MSDSIIMLSDMKPNSLQKIKHLEERIVALKALLGKLGALHPGSLSRQYNVCGKLGCRCKDPQRPRRHGPYYQLNYVFRGKKTSRFIPRQEVAQLRTQLANYKTLRRSTQQWTALALHLAQIRRKLKT
jgi:hypothetical protein